MHDPVLYEARRSRLLFVVLLTGLGLAAFVAQGSPASEAEASTVVAAGPAQSGEPSTDAAARTTSTTAAVALEAPATMLVSAEVETTTTTAPPTTAPPTTVAPQLAVAPPTTQPPAPPTTAAPSNAQSGTATWYEGGTSHGCAHLTLPKGTVVTVTAVSSGRSVTCTVDDRGPFGSHIIDLSPTGFQALAPLSAGVVSVRITW